MKKQIHITLVLLFISLVSVSQIAVDSIEKEKLRAIIYKAEQRDSTQWVSDTIPISPIVEFDHEGFDIQTIDQGKVVTHRFHFKNVGNDTLRIFGVTPDCSCSSSEWTTSPVEPGQMGFVQVTYDSRDDIGKISKTVTVLHNAGEGYTFLTLTGFVSAKF